jgi:hypothetical protein
MKSQCPEIGTIVAVHVVRQGKGAGPAIVLTGLKVRLTDGREVAVEVDSRAPKFLRRCESLVGRSVEVEVGEGNSQFRVLSFGRGL